MGGASEGSYRSRQRLLNRILLPIKEFAWVGQVTLQTRAFTCARLFWLRKRKKRFVPGTFRFPFGPVRYIDAGVLLGLYLEIFLDRAYEVQGLGPSPFIIDCGANIGLSVIQAKQCYPHARILAFEAEPAIAATLEANVAALGLADVEVVRAAVGGFNGMVTFVSKGSLGGHVSAADGQGVTVKAVRLSDYINEPVDMLKVDIEGSEFDLIHDLCATGKISFIRHMICEVHGNSRMLERVAALWSDLAKAGFRVTISRAMINAGLPGPSDPVPFPAIESGKYLVWFYAWHE